MTFVVATEKLITETFEGRDQRDKFAVDIKVRGLRLKPRLETRMMIYVQRNPRTCTLAHMQLHTYTPSELATGESTPPRVRLNDELVASLEPPPGDLARQLHSHPLR